MLFCLTEMHYLSVGKNQPSIYYFEIMIHFPSYCYSIPIYLIE